MRYLLRVLYIAMSLMFFMVPNAGAYDGRDYDYEAEIYAECMEEHDDSDYCWDEVGSSSIPLPVWLFFGGLAYCLEQRKNFQLYSSGPMRRKHPYVSLRERPDDIYRYTLFAGLAIGFGIEEVYYGTMRLVGFY